MNPRMWAADATRANTDTLRRRGVQLVGPAAGDTAEGELGVGRMAEPEEIAGAIERRLAVAGQLAGRRVLVTAGGTREPLDAVRYIGNRSSGRMGVAVADEASLTQVVRRMMGSQLEPMAFEVDVRSRSTQNPQSKNFSASSAASAFNVLLRFASLPVVVDAQVAGATEALQGIATSIDVVEGYAERMLWRAQATRLWDGAGAIVRASWLPASIAAVLSELPAGAELIGRAAIGAGLVRLDGDEAEQARVIGQLRHSPHVGNVVVLRGSAALKGLVDVWGPQGDRQRLSSAIKHAFDPNGVLNAGRGPL